VLYVMCLQTHYVPRQQNRGAHSQQRRKEKERKKDRK